MDFLCGTGAMLRDDGRFGCGCQIVCLFCDWLVAAQSFAAKLVMICDWCRIGGDNIARLGGLNIWR
jgi:hypothetical protein